MQLLKKLFLKNTSEIRKDDLMNHYTIITPSRSKRLHNIQNISQNTSCFFCRPNVLKKNILDFVGSNIDKWNVVSIQNMFPAVSLNNPKAYGTHEVIIDTPNHEINFSDLSITQIKKVLKMYSKRTAALSKNKKINYILCFKNQGSRAGASITHSHSQVFASSILPPIIQEETVLAKIYKQKNKGCFYCDLVKKEMCGPRKIFEDKFIAVFTPYASTYHYEAWILTKRHLDNITLLNNQELLSFAKILKKLLAKLNSQNIDYNFFLHQTISEPDQHFYLKIQPRDNTWAGLELGSNMIINSISPEVAAKFYCK